MAANSGNKAGDSGGGNHQFFVRQATDVLTCLLLAAAIGEQPLSSFVEWCLSDQAQEPVQILAGYPEFASQWRTLTSAQQLVPETYVGVWQTLRGEWGRRQMQRALPGFSLPEPPGGPAAPDLPVHLLIGARYLAEACLVSHSLAWAARRPVEPHFYDDGTLTPVDCDFLRAKLPRAHITGAGEIDERLAAVLPEERFRCLRRLRLAYPHVRKLTDIHLFPGEWKLVSDADKWTQLATFRYPIGQ